MENNKQTGAHVLKGAMILSSAVFISKVIGILYRIPLTGAIGNSGNGIFGPSFQVYMVMLTLSSVALPTAISKMVSERRAIGAYKDAHQVYKVAMIYSALMGAILSILLWFGADFIASFFFKIPEAANSMRSLVPAVFFVSIIAVMRGYFQGMSFMTPTALSQVIEQLVNAIVCITLAYTFIHKSLQAAITGASFGTSAGAFVSLLVLVSIYYMVKPNLYKRINKSTVSTHETNKEILKKLLIMSVPIMISSSVFSIMGLIDYSMMYNILPGTIAKLSESGQLATLPISDPQVLLDQKEIVSSLAGQFSAKYTPLINLPVNLILTLGMAVIPAISAATAKKDFKEVRLKTNMVLKIGMLIAVPASIGLMVFGEQVVKFLFSSSPDGGQLLAYGSISIIFITLAQITTGVLQGMGKQSIPTIHAAIACAVKVVANLILLSRPSMHIYGVVHSTTICYFVYALLNVTYLVRTIHIKISLKKLVIKPLFVASIMGIISAVLFHLSVNMWGHANLMMLILIPIAILIYGFLGLITRTITIKDLENIPGGNKIIRFLVR